MEVSLANTDKWQPRGDGKEDEMKKLTADELKQIDGGVVVDTNLP